MVDENPLIRRGKSGAAHGAIPVTTRRREEAIEPLPPQSQPPAAQQPYVVFIPTPQQPMAGSMMPAQPSPVAPPAQHFHTTTTTTHHHHYSVRRQQQMGHSALGIASLALGVVACIICWVPLAGLAAVPIGAIGAVLGILGVIISVFFRRSSAALPMSGVFVCVLAASISIASTGSLVYWRKQIEHFARQLQPKPAATPSHSIATPTAPLPTISHSSAAPPPAVRSRAATPPPPPNPVVLSAAQQLKDAETVAAERAKQTDEYRTAVDRAAAARAEVAALREQSPNSAALHDASQRMIDADNQISAIIQKTQDADSAVQSARTALNAARGSTSAP
ncbi:MAG: DUF308 domain-containing protein [Phycisphaerae bacterium]|nr:DUF308 domain-containing protein [Phycisphaerae bacterium]